VKKSRENCRRRLRSESGKSRIAVGGVADEREVVGDRFGVTPNFCYARALRAFRSCIDLRRSPATPATDLCPASRCRSSGPFGLAPTAPPRMPRIIGLQLDHRPDDDAHRVDASSIGWNCAHSALDARAGLYPATARGTTDDVIGRDRCASPSRSSRASCAPRGPRRARITVGAPQA
jgi:hypothetical protein